jgi:SMODS and SLOG-associating 2TM effector domain 1
MTDDASAVAAGRIPFRIRIGVTGHKDVDQHIGRVVREQVRWIRDELLSGRVANATPIRLAVVSLLAEGADRLVIHEVLAEAESRQEDARIEVILPMDKGRYIAEQNFDDGLTEEFEQLLAIARPKSLIDDPLLPEQDAYKTAGHQLVNRCDVLLALWNGQPGKGAGGTAAVLQWAAAHGKPCIWVSTTDGTVKDNIRSETRADFYRTVDERAALPHDSRPRPVTPRDDPVEVMREALRDLDDFNTAGLPRGFNRRRDEQLAADGAEPWVTNAYLRASLLAGRNQRRFIRTAWAVAFCGTAAGVMLALSLSYGKDFAGWAWAEAAFLLAIGLGLLIVHFRGWHSRWLSYRLLAERLRSAFYLAPTGVEFSRSAGFEAVFVERRSEEWLRRSFEEVWDRRPNGPATGPVRDEDLARLKQSLAERWIQVQIDFHKSKAAYHNRLHWILTGIVFALFGLTIPVAIAHALEWLENVMIILSIVLPAAGASLGILLTVSQHRALKERYSKMGSDLESVQAAVRESDAETLQTVSLEAARVIAEESGDWFGAMWFLDIEHPP